MAEKKEKRNVVFRRIGGRIVPIAIGAGAIGAARKIDVEKHGMRLQQKSLNKLNKIVEKGRPLDFQEDQSKWSKYFSTEGKKVKSLKGIYASDLKRLNTSVQYNPTRDSYFNRKGLVSPYISLRSGNQAVFLHELGHAAQKGGKLDRLEDLSRKIYNSNAGRLNAKMMNWKYKPNLKLSLKQKTINAAASANLKFGVGYKAFFKRANEVDAWVRAFKYAKTSKMKANVVKTSIPALGTYLGKDVVKLGKYGLIAAGASAIGYGILKKDKK